MNAIDGTAGDDFIIVGVASARVTPGTGDDFLVGGPGDNRYVVSAGGGKDTLYEVEGSNYVEFDSSIGYGDVSGGLMKSGNDLILNVGQSGQSLTIKSFFTVDGTIQEFQFSTGQTLPASLLFQVFGLTAPTETKVSKVPYIGDEGAPLLTGTEAGDILIPIDDTEMLQGQAGDDFLVGRASGVTFEIGLGNGEDFIVAYEGQNVVLFVDGISFSDVASNLMKSGDDLILSNGDAGNEVRIYKFFTRANTVSAIRFESGGEIAAEQIISMFGVPEPAQVPPFQMIIDGTSLGGVGDGSDPGDGGLPLCSEPEADPENCDDGSGENPPPDDTCDPTTENCDGTGGGDTGGGGSDPGNEWPELLRLTGTGDADILVVSADATLVTGGAGDDFLIGGPADDRYRIDAGDGRDTIHDVEGQNVIEFLSGISYSDVTSGLMKAGDDLVLYIGQSGQSLTIKRFFVIDNTISALEFQNGSQLTGAQLFQAFGVTPPATVAQSLQLFAGKADGSPLVGSASPDILIPRMGTKVVQGLSGDDYLIGRIGYGGSVSGSGGGSAMEGITFEIEQDSGKKFIIAYEGYNTVYYTSGTSKSDLTYSRMADDLILGNSQNNSEVRVHQFFVRQNTVRNIQFADGGQIGYYQLFEMFNAEPPIPPDSPLPATPDDPFNMVVAGASFDSCSSNPALANAEGYGLTASQLSEANQLPVIISTPGLEAWALKKFEYRVLAADSNNDELCIGLNEAPEGMMVDAPFGLISWEPSRSQLGFHQVEIAVTDERGGQVIQNFEIEVKDPNLPPVIVSAPPKRALEGLSYTYEVLVSDPNDGEPVLEVISGPEGMVATDGDIVWTPGFDHIGVHDIVIRASDIYGASDTQSFQLTVVPFTDTEHLPDGMSRLPMTGYRVPVHPMDDATTQAGTPRVYVRNDLLDIVLDPVNGLIWEDTDNVDVSFDGLNDAARFCQNLVHGGIDTWRLPNRLELVFLLEHHRTRYRNNLINSAFKHTGMEFFAIDVSNHKPLTNYHSTVHFGTGELKPESTGRAHARCVSGEQRFVPDFFRPMEQNVTVDRANRLMWQDDAQVLVSNVAWPAALESCETLELAGHSDWRLPNFNESQTLMQEFDHFVTLENPSDVFLNVPDVRHWASSTPTTPGWSRAPYALENLTQFWRFEYQSEIASGLAVNHVHQLPYSQQSNTPVRCVRNYAEPVARIESHPTSINFGESLTLDASSSSDSDGTIISYQWYSLTDDADLGSDPVLHLDSLASGEHSLRLTVTDNNGLTQAYPESIVITVIRPIEIAIDGESSVRLGQNVVLDASGTSGAGGIVSFKWIDDTTGDVVGNQAILNLEGLGAGARNYTLEVIDSIGQVLGTSFEVTVTEVRPIAAVVNDAHTVSEGSSVTLDASESTDADGEIVAYRWFAAGSSELLGDAAQLTLSDLQVGIWSYRLEVEDDSGLVDTKTVSVVVGYEPTVSLDDSHVVSEGSSLTLDASGSSDSDGEIVAYRWFADGSTELLSGAAQLALSELPVGTWIYRLEVEDDMGLVSTKAVTVVVGYQPVAVVDDSHVVSEGSSLTLDASDSTDADGEIVAYRWFAAGSTELLGDAAQLTLSDLQVGTWSYRLEVEDDSGLVDTKTVSVVVGYEPTVSLDDSHVVNAGSSLTLDASGSSDSDGEIVAYRWFADGSTELLGDAAQLALSDLQVGTWTYRLEVEDDMGLVSTKTVTVVVGYQPIAVVDDSHVVSEGSSLTLDASGSTDADGEIVAYRWFAAGSSELLGDAAQLALSELPVGTWAYRLEIEDDSGLIGTKAVTVVVGYTPKAVAPDVVSGYAGTQIDLNASGSSVASGTLAYQWFINGQLISEQATVLIDHLEAGSHTVELVVTTELGLSDSKLVTIEVLGTRELAQCPANPVTDDRGYEKLYPENDAEWMGNDAATVEDIERAFNFARSQDPSVFQYLIMPPQIVWDAMTVQEKGLYLVNAERMARGIKPYEGVAAEVSTVAQKYSDYILTRNEIIGHYNDGLNPNDRLDVDAYIAENRDAHVRSESIAAGYGSARGEQFTVDSALVRAIFDWIYQDKAWFEDFDGLDGPAWGHRDQLLQTALNENNGIPTAEGLIGFGVSRGLYFPGQASPETYGYVTVFHTIDQSGRWNLSTVGMVDTSAAQGCNTAHILDIDESLIETNGLSEIRVSPSTLMMVPGTSQSLQVVGVYDNGNQSNLTPYASFMADSRSIVSVSGGVVTAEQTGQAQVFARINGLESNRLFVRVREATDISNIQGTAAEAYSEYVPDNASVTGYDPMAMAVYTGVVQDRNGQPLEGVQASFLNQPELGSTKTDSNGRFIIAGPAGQQTIVYEMPGRLVVQRTTIGASNTWSNLEDVMLLLRDSKQTLIDLRSSEPQIHQSTPVNDEFGKRQATIVFNGITSATVLSADGSTRSLDSFLLSATEFETPASMPGELPSEVAFTFANELHAAGVYYNDTVVFDNDVVMFIDNFLGFEVGEIVPIGYFDHLDNQWAASSNGVVVQLLDTSGDGTVDGLDYTGDSLPDDLNGNGNTQDDVLGLEDYNAGDTLWWGSFNHFTSYDYNWGSSEDEAPTELGTDLGQEDENNGETECTGSYVKPYQQAFHEDISIAGTELTLHYSSQRTEGYKHKARIKVSGASIPSTLEQMIVKLEVAGRVFQRKLAPATNTEVEFIWDGTRVDGVRPKGMVSGRVSIGYEYKAQYISAGNAAAEERELSDFPVAWAQVGDSVTAVPGRQNYISWQTRGVSFKNSFDRQLGNGWSLSNVHEFDPAGRVYLGNGGVVDVETQSLILRTGLTYSLLDGDDGYYQSGGSTIDYTVNDEAVLVDKVTGLEWQFTDRPFETRSKAEAQAYCATEAEPKDSGWRLPTHKEVGYTIEKSGANIGPAIYSLTQARRLWRQRTVNFDDQLLPVMCVRGESIDDRYVQGLQRDAAQQVVVDKDNGLMWQDAPENALTKRDWAASIQHCEATTFAGFDDWRMPNINELLYVLPNNVFQHQSELVFPPGILWNYQASFRQPYWSSTTNYQEDTQAWAIESLSFNSARFSKSDQYYVRCVRDAASSARMPYRFDKDGKHIATIDLDSGNTLVEFSYNDSDKLVGMTDQFGNHIAIERDVNGTPTRIVAADGQVTELTVNEQNNLTALAYEDASQYQFFYQVGGLLTEKVDPNGHSYPHEFDENGRVYQTRDPEGGQWDFFDTRVGIGHDKYGYTTAEGEHYQTVRRVLENGDVRKEITYKNGATLIDILRADQLQQTTTYGGVTTVVDKVLDSKTLQEIPSAITVSQPSGLTQSTTLSTVYGQNGADTSRYTVTASVNGDTSTTEVDARAGTLMQTSAEGRVVREQVDPETLLTQSISVTGLLDSEFTYDARGRLIQETVGDRSTSYTFGSEGRGQVTAITAADGKQTFYEYDLLGRVTKITYPDGHTTLSEYDENGNRTTLVVPTPADHDSAYNGINRVTSEATPLGETTQYEYDRDRRLTAIELPSGQRLEHTYSQNRLTRTDTPEGAILYDYHHGDQLSQITEGGESLSYNWDGTLLMAVNYQGELNEGIQYQYNPDYQISQITYAGDSTSLTYDRDGLLTGIHGFAIGRHADHGLPVSLDDGTLSKTFGYNGHGEVTVVSTELNQAAVFDYELTYNSVGQIVGKTETLPDGTVNQYGYEYDDRYRLTEVTKNSQLVEQYQYDANGNRTLATSTERGVSGVSASYNLGDQLQSFGNTSYTYDGNGSLSQKTTGTEITTYNYDNQGRLKQVQTPDHTIQYRHNALGNRVAKLKDGQVTERYLWQDKTTLLATYDGQGNLKKRFEYTLGHAPTSFTENGNIYYLLTDQLGSPRVITDSAGQVVKTVEYDAYGNVTADSNPGLTLPFGFAGGLKDDDTGLIRFGYRDYDPETGRWTARDPIGFAGGDTNLYGYVSNDPVNFVDPTGEFGWAIVGAIVGAGGELAWQMIVEGKSLGCVNVTKVAAAATMGALGGWASGLNKLNKVSKTVTPNAAQQKNIDRFQKKIPANAKDNVKTHGLPNDGVAVQATSPGRVPGSKAVYEKQIDAAGKTTQYTKTTYGPKGEIIHVKDKINGGVYP